MKFAKELIRNRIVLSVVTALAGTLGTVLATEYSAIHQAICF